MCPIICDWNFPAFLREMCLIKLKCPLFLPLRFSFVSPGMLDVCTVFNLELFWFVFESCRICFILLDFLFSFDFVFQPLVTLSSSLFQTIDRFV